MTPAPSLRAIALEYVAHLEGYKAAMARGNMDRADDELSAMQVMEHGIFIIDGRKTGGEN